MHIEQLVTMANDIANFFHGASAPGQAPGAIAAHLRSFWDPRMRRQIIEHYRSHGGEGLNELARAAVGLLANAPATGSASTAATPMQSG